jgi:DNA mismatch endonuclease (patch repair protein)
MLTITTGHAPAAAHPLTRLTGPERTVQAALTRLAPGGFRCHAAELPGTPDLVLDETKTAIFVHGCFWHAHGCQLSRTPKTNRPFWEAKFNRNRARDAVALAALHRRGWRTVVVWECAVRSFPPGRLTEALAEALQARCLHGEIAAGPRAGSAAA